MPQLIPAPTRIPVPGGKVIDEYVGAVNTPQTSLPASVSVAHMNAPAEWDSEEGKRLIEAAIAGSKAPTS